VAETWILLSAALALVLEYYRVPHVAKAKLIEALRQGKVRWRCAGFDGFRWDKNDLGDGDPHFWCDWSGPPWDPPQRGYQPVLRFDWERSYVRRSHHGAYRIEVVLEDVQAWLGIAPQPAPELVSSSGVPSGGQPAQSAQPAQSMDAVPPAELVKPKPKPKPKPKFKSVSDRDLRDCVKAIPREWLFEPKRGEAEIRQRIEDALGGPIQRYRIRSALKKHVKGRRGRGRPRKSIEIDRKKSP
jgi:hypothetical protein